jgi:hypothetical protein
MIERLIFDCLVPAALVVFAIVNIVAVCVH